jgi:TRAP-type C4-dicarboxylate transport system substrate-binding protein
MKRKKTLMFFELVLIMVLAFAIFSPMGAGAADKIKWRLTYFAGPPNDQIANALDWWAKEVTKRSNNRLEIERFWFGSLAPAGQEFEGLKSGLFQVAMFIPAFSPSKLPLMNMQFLPCLIPITSDSEEGFHTFMKIQDDFLRTPAITEELERWDAKLLFTAACPEYYRLMGNAKITSIEDLKGKKVRAIAGIGDLMSNVGATPISTTGPEMYDALSKGVVELVSHAPSLFVNMKLIEVSKYYIPSINLGNMGGTPVVSKKAYDQLPVDLKKIVDEVSKEAFAVHIKYWVEAEANYVKAIKEKGLEVVNFSADSQKQLREISHDVIWKSYVDKLEGQGGKAKETFNSLQDIIKKHIPDHNPLYL